LATRPARDVMLLATTVAPRCSAGAALAVPAGLVAPESITQTTERRVVPQQTTGFTQ